MAYISDKNLILEDGKYVDLGTKIVSAETFLTADEIASISGTINAQTVYLIAASNDELVELIDTTSGTLQDEIDGLSLDHDALNNLDYDSSGHTGFVSTTDLATLSGAVVGAYIEAYDNPTIYYMMLNDDEDKTDSFLFGPEPELNYTFYLKKAVDHDGEVHSYIVNVDSGEYEIMRNITYSGSPNITNIPAGDWIWDLWAATYNQPESAESYIRAKWYKRNPAGTETYLFTQEQQLDYGVGEFDPNYGTMVYTKYYQVITSVSGISLDATDRLVVKIFGESDAEAMDGGINENRIGYRAEGNTPSSFTIPAQTEKKLLHSDMEHLTYESSGHVGFATYESVFDLNNDLSNHMGGGDHDGRYYTESELNNGKLNNQYYTETELNAGQLDNRYHRMNFETITLDADDITNKYIDLAVAPKTDDSLVLTVRGGTEGWLDVDYTVSGARVSWSSKEWDGVLVEGGMIKVVCYY